MRNRDESQIRTSAVRKLIPEADILQMKYRIDLGVPLHTAVRIIRPDMSGVSTVKLVRWHTEMEEALAQDDFVLYDNMAQSLFPPWVQDDSPQPRDACYIGRFPYGQWEYEE